MTALRARRVISLMVALAVFGAGCVPAATVSDTLDLGVLGRWSEPGIEVGGGVSTDGCSSHGLGSVSLGVVAADAEGNVVAYFQMRRRQTQPNPPYFTPLPTAGSYPYSFDPALGTEFAVGFGDTINDPTYGYGFLSVAEITLERQNIPSCGEVYEITRLRATAWVDTPHAGITNVSMNIG